MRPSLLVTHLLMVVIIDVEGGITKAFLMTDITRVFFTCPALAREPFRGSSIENFSVM